MRGPDVNQLRAAADAVPAAGLAVRELLGSIPGATVPWLIVLCTIPAAIPGMQLGWVCVPLMLALARSLAAGERHLRLPVRVAGTRVGQANARRLLRALGWTAQAYQRWCRPRGARIVRMLRRGPAAALVVLMALMILLPLPGSNLLPAVSVVLLMGGLLWRDGYAILAAWLAAIASVLVTVGILAAGWKLATTAL